MKIKLLNIYFIFLSMLTLFGQQKPKIEIDSLLKSSYEEIYLKASEVYLDTILAKQYLQVYIDKAVKEKNQLRLGAGLAFMAHFIPEEKHKLTLLDSAIFLTKNREHKTIPILPYSFKGFHYLMKYNYNKSLNNYIQAFELSQENQNESFMYMMKHNIAVLKGEIGQTEEALKLLKEGLEHERSKGDLSSHGYITSLLYVSEYLIKNGQLKPAGLYIEEGIIKSKNTFENLYNGFLLQKAILLIEYGKPRSAQKIFVEISDSFSSIDPSNKKNRVVLNYYLGKAAAIQGEEKDARDHFLKMDTIISSNGYTSNEIRDAYTFLINHYSEEGNQKRQLQFIEKLLQIDSTNSSNGINIARRLNSEFDTPQLMLSRKKLIEKLQKSNSEASSWLQILSIFLIMSVCASGYIFYREMKLKRKFNRLHNSVIIDTNHSDKESINFKKQPAQLIENSSANTFEIPSEITQNILDGLETFESKKEFLNRKLNSTLLAKKLNTNVKYLSFTINKEKNKNFSAYLRDLRINYALKWLKENDEMRRKFTIAGIASEMGFNNAESFSSAFRKSTGLNPSYYIKQLNKI